MFGANVGSKLCVTPDLVLPLHFGDRSAANAPPRRLKYPITVGAAKALKVLALNPYELALHWWQYKPKHVQNGTVLGCGEMPKQRAEAFHTQGLEASGV